MSCNCLIKELKFTINKLNNTSIVTDISKEDRIHYLCVSISVSAYKRMPRR